MCTGNDNLRLLTSDKRQRLRIDLAKFDGSSRYAEYNSFAVGTAADKYRIVSLGRYYGTAGQYDVKYLAATLNQLFFGMSMQVRKISINFEYFQLEVIYTVSVHIWS